MLIKEKLFFSQDCDFDEFCFNNNCYKDRCRHPQDCGQGHDCVRDRCIWGCQDDSDCPQEKYCKRGKCFVKPEDDCEDHVQCGLDGFCINGKCTPDCEDGSDCRSYEVCYKHKCIPRKCKRDVDCGSPLANKCRRKRCIWDCDDDADCPESNFKILTYYANYLLKKMNNLDKKCVQKECKPTEEPCDEDEDCHDTDICVDGKCKGKCLRDRDCQEGFV